MAAIGIPGQPGYVKGHRSADKMRKALGLLWRVNFAQGNLSGPRGQSANGALIAQESQDEWESGFCTEETYTTRSRSPQPRTEGVRSGAGRCLSADKMVRKAIQRCY